MLCWIMFRFAKVLPALFHENSDRQPWRHQPAPLCCSIALCCIIQPSIDPTRRTASRIGCFHIRTSNIDKARHSIQCPSTFRVTCLAPGTCSTYSQYFTTNPRRRVCILSCSAFRCWCSLIYSIAQFGKALPYAVRRCSPCASPRSILHGFSSYCHLPRSVRSPFRRSCVNITARHPNCRTNGPTVPSRFSFRSRCIRFESVAKLTQPLSRVSSNKCQYIGLMERGRLRQPSQIAAASCRQRSRAAETQNGAI